VATHRFRAPTKIITTQRAPQDTPPFLLSLVDDIQVLDTAMYFLSYFLHIYFSWFGWDSCTEEVDNLTVKIMSR